MTSQRRHGRETRRHFHPWPDEMRRHFHSRPGRYRRGVWAGRWAVRLAGALVLFRAYGVRCIFATGVTNPQARERAAPAAPLKWLQKPFSMNALISAVDHALAEIAKQD